MSFGPPDARPTSSAFGPQPSAQPAAGFQTAKQRAAQLRSNAETLTRTCADYFGRSSPRPSRRQLRPMMSRRPVYDSLCGLQYDQRRPSPATRSSGQDEPPRLASVRGSNAKHRPTTNSSPARWHFGTSCFRVKVHHARITGFCKQINLIMLWTKSENSWSSLPFKIGLRSRNQASLR